MSTIAAGETRLIDAKPRIAAFATALEVSLVYAGILYYVWLWRFTHPRLWMLILGIILVSQLARRDSLRALGLAPSQLWASAQIVLAPRGGGLRSPSCLRARAPQPDPHLTRNGDAYIARSLRDLVPHPGIPDAIVLSQPINDRDSKSSPALPCHCVDVWRSSYSESGSHARHDNRRILSR